MRLFKKDPVKKLRKKYDALMKEGYRLSTIDRMASIEKYGEADEVMREIEEISAVSEK